MLLREAEARILYADRVVITTGSRPASLPLFPQGLRVAAENSLILGVAMDYRVVPRCVFSLPEYSALGLSEEVKAALVAGMAGTLGIEFQSGKLGSEEWALACDFASEGIFNY